MIGGLSQHRDHARVGVHVLGDLGNGDLDRSLGFGPLQRRRDPPGVAGIALRHHLQSETHVADLAGQRPLRRHELRHQRSLRGGARIEGRDAALGRLDGGDTVALRGPAQRTADVIAMGDGADAGGNGGARAARRATARDGGIPGIACQPVQRVVGEAAHGEFRRVGQAENDRARLLQVRGYRGIAGRDVVLEGHDAIGIGLALDIDIDLDGDGNAVQRPDLGALLLAFGAVSYTHLDVYKRQERGFAEGDGNQQRGMRREMAHHEGEQDQAAGKAKIGAQQRWIQRHLLSRRSRIGAES